MKTKITALIAALAVGGSILLATGGSVAAANPANEGPSGKGVCSAQAATAKAAPNNIAALQAFGDCEINRRFATLNDLSAKVSGSKFLTSSDAAALNGIISSTRSGLTNLKATIDAETDATALKADIAKIATDYRVYLVVVPQVNLVNAADAVIFSQTKFATLNTNLSARIAAAKAAGKDTTAAQADLDAMNASVAAAVNLATPLPAKLLALTPASHNAGTAGPVIAAARTALGTARDDLKSALASANACRVALK